MGEPVLFAKRTIAANNTWETLVAAVPGRRIRLHSGKALKSGTDPGKTITLRWSGGTEHIMLRNTVSTGASDDFDLGKGYLQGPAGEGLEVRVSDATSPDNIVQVFYSVAAG